MTVADTVSVPPSPVRAYRWSTGMSICITGGVLVALPQFLVASSLQPILTIAQWAIWGAVFAPLVYWLTRTVWHALALAVPVILLYGFVVSSNDAFQALVLYSFTAGYRLLVDQAERRLVVEAERREIDDRFVVARAGTLLHQLQPHFMFNSLNTISSLAAYDPPRAAEVAGELRDLFEWSSRVGPTVTLDEELEFTAKYVDIQKARFEDRLRVTVSVDPESLALRVPSLLLQPLVENAIRHSMTRREGVTIEIIITRAEAELLLRVENDGCTDSHEEVVEGVGLSNTRARLSAIHGERASLSAARAAEGRFVAEVRLPITR